MKNPRPIERGQSFSRQDPNEILAQLLGVRFAAYRRAWRKAELGERPDFPLHLDVDLISACNLRCPMCPAGQPDSGFPGLGLKLPEASYLKALEEGRDRLPSIRLGVTGEPLLRPDVDQWVEAARSHGVMDLALITNGQLLSPKMSAKLIKAGLTRLMVSVDAASQETYQITRPGGDWGLLWANIGAFLAIRSSLNSPLPLLRLSFVEMTLNQNERVKFQEDFGEMADYLSFQKYQNILGLKRTNWGLSAPSPGFCPDPLTRLTLFANGSLFPCCSDFGRKASLGHFPEKTLAEAWNSPLAVALARDQGWAANCQECQRASDPTILGSATVSQTHHRDQSLDQLIEQPWPNILGSAPSQARVPEGR